MNSLSARGRQRRLRQLTISLLLAFFAVAVALVVWGILRAPTLAQRADNPRLVESELRIRRGSIWDSNNALIAETVGPDEDPQRVYPMATIGPAIGYYSFRHSTAGVEAGYDSVLRGDSEDEWVNFVRESLHLPQTGRDIRVTLDMNWQRVADVLMEDHQGALILLTVPDGAIRSMVSRPGFDPNFLDEQFDELASDESSPLLNRAAQSQYQPGMALQPFLIAGALDEGIIALDDVLVDVGRPVPVNGQVVECDTVVAVEATWAEVLRSRCPGPMLALGERMGAVGLDAVFDAFGLFRAPQLPINTETPPVAGTLDAMLAAIGQDNLVVTPLQMSLALASLVNEGILPNPQLVPAVQGENGDWEIEPHVALGESAVSAETSRRLFAALSYEGGVIAEHVAEALSGPEGRTIGWYMGVAPAAAPRYVVLVVVEDDQGAAGAKRAGRALLQHILGATE